MSQYKYEIVEKKEGDYKGSVIEKSNVTVKFTLAEMETELFQLEKYLTEFEANKKIQDAKISNVEEHHAFVKDLTPEQLFTVHMYFEAKSASMAFEKKMEEFLQQKVEAKNEMDEIYKQLGFEKIDETKKD